jgi:predicted dehydrogenase
MPPVNCRAAIIGCGRVGCGFDEQPWKQVRTHAGAYIRTHGVDLIALADIDPLKLARYGDRFGVPDRYTDYRQMLSRERVDVLSVCTGSDHHAEIIEAAVSAGVRAIVCEKPFTDGLDRADRAISLCEDAGVPLLVNHSRRFDAYHRRIAEWLRGGGLGALQYAAARYGAGCLNSGTHLFDLLRLYLGEARWVRALRSPNSSGNPADANLDVWLGFDDGIHAAVQACDARAFIAFEITVAGTNGRIHIASEGFDVTVRFEQATESERFPGYRVLEPATCPVDESRSDELMLRVVENAVACAERRERPHCSGHDGRAALAIAMSARTSSDADGRVVLIPTPLESQHV